MVRSLIALVALAAAVSACTTVSDAPPPSGIVLAKAVHFSGAEGTSVVAEAGTYHVEDAGNGKLRLVPQTAGAPVIVEAQPTKYDEPLSDLLALSIPYKEDEHHVVLLKPDGTALDAVGSYSGLATRATATLVPLSSSFLYQYRYSKQPLAGSTSSTPPPPPPNPNPDLVITSAVMTPLSPTPYDLAMLQLTVKNQGLTDAKLDPLNATQLSQGMRHLNVQLWDATGKPVKGWGMEIANLPVTIAAGTSQTLNVPQVTLLTDTVGTFRWDITLYSYITEANAGNNTYTTNFTVQPRPTITGPAPDLVVSGCSFLPANPTQRDFIIQFVGQYTNQGTVAANLPFSTPLLMWTSTPAIGGRSVFRWMIGSQVMPGAVQSIQQQLNVSQASAGTYQITVTIDPDNRVGETNKSNNVVSCMLTVGP